MTSVTVKPVVCHVGLGANLGNARAQVEQALARLDQLPDTRMTTMSDLFITAPIDATGDDYINAVARLETRLCPASLLHELQALEQEFGRERPYVNAPRALDLDLLLYGDHTIHTPALTVPHPRMTQRAFVMIPLLQVDPFITIPGMGPAHSFVSSVSGQSIRRL
jgi:2-amino-4-hydroxy-6-hydroxymethyldihydropteridine diphosphokinase